MISAADFTHQIDDLYRSQFIPAEHRQTSQTAPNEWSAAARNLLRTMVEKAATQSSAANSVAYLYQALFVPTVHQSSQTARDEWWSTAVRNAVCARIETTSRSWASNSLNVDPWLLAVQQHIQDYRQLTDGWDGLAAPAPDDGSLDLAESIAEAFLFVPTNRRPSFTVDARGRPSFAANSSDFYLHLAVESPTSVAWYAVINGAEDFGDDDTSTAEEVRTRVGRLVQAATPV